MHRILEVVLPQAVARTAIGRRASRLQSGVVGSMFGASMKGQVVRQQRWHSLITCTRGQRSGASASSTTGPCTSSGPIPASTLPSSAPPVNSEDCRRPSIFDSSSKAGSKDSPTDDYSFHLLFRMGPKEPLPCLVAAPPLQIGDLLPASCASDWLRTRWFLAAGRAFECEPQRAPGKVGGPGESELPRHPV